jgi:galactonate dehydratase
LPNDLQDGAGINSVHRPLTAWQYPVVNNIRMNALAKSGLNQALWDITAKYYKIPLYKLYGADGVNKVPLYANLNNAIRSRRTPEDLYEQGLTARDQGFRVVKCTPFDEVNPTNADNSLEKGFERLQALTGVWPIEKIAIDCHQRFGRRDLGVMVKRLLSEFGNPYWLEDPVPVLDYETMKIMVAHYPEVRWVAGEDSYTVADIMRTACSNCYDILMPDVKYIGGPGVIRGMIQTFEGMGKKVTLHNPSGIIATAHSAHLSSLCGGMPLEYPVGAVEDRVLLGIPQENIMSGDYLLNNEPGIGIAITEDAFEKYAKEMTDFEWIDYRRR